MSPASLSDLTRNAFQSGIPASKWLSLCKQYISQSLVHVPGPEIEASLSNSVLALFRNYPGDPGLQAYLQHALRDGLLSLPTYVSTFLAAARSLELHNTSTLDLLCRVARDHYRSLGTPPLIGSLVAFGESPIVILNTVQDAMALVKTAGALPSTHYHQLTDNASELLRLLLAIAMATELTNISTVQLQMVFNEANDTLGSLRGISPELKSKLEDLLFRLYDAIGDDSKAAREAQMMQTLQLALGKGDVIGGNYDRDIITCGLLLHALVTHRANDFGSGDGRRAVVLLIALVRSASWTPATFYTQLLQAAVTSFAQHASISPTSKSTMLWRAFVVGRLPQLLVMFEKAVDLEGTSEADWRPAMHTAVTSLIHQPDLLSKCDAVYHQPQADGSANQPSQGPHFISEFLHQLLTLGLIDQNSAASMNPTLQNDFHPRVQTEAQEHGSDIEAYLESRLGSDVSMEDMASTVDKIWRDPCSHSAFAEIINKRFRAAASSNDIEALGHLCKVLYTHEHALDVLSLHVKVPELVAHGLAIVEDYDCETVGDPQTAVTHYGSLVLFLQVALSRFNLASSTFAVGDRILTTEILNASTMIYRSDEYKEEDKSTFETWTKTLFDSGSEGIEDSILRSTRPRSLLRMAATLLAHAIVASIERKLDKEAFKNGVSYFCGPLLNWTLAGVVKALVRESSHKAFIVPVHLEVLQLLLQPRSCPEPVLRLSAANILRVFPTTKAPQIPGRPPPYDPAPIRKIAMQALRIPTDEPSSTTTPSVPLAVPISDPVLHAIREALSAARAGKAPALDVERCLLFSNPTRFLTALWGELSVASTMGELEAPRRIATFVLSTPRAPRSPPLLPIFLHVVLPNLITSADHLAPTERTLAIELLVAVISSALMAALYVEWALLSVCKEQRLVLGQPALTMARRLSGDLRRRTHSPASAMIVQRLASSSTFMANFPTFMSEL